MTYLGFNILAILIVTLIYYTGFFAASLFTGVCHNHYFLGFGKKSLFDVTIRKVRFSVGWFIPFFLLARYYAIEGDKKKRPDYPWQFFQRGKGVRIFVTYSGVITVVLTAFLMMVASRYFTEQTFLAVAEVNKMGIYPSKVAAEAGFEKGDKILNVNGRFVGEFDSVAMLVATAPRETQVTVLRKGEEKTIRILGINTQRILYPLCPSTVDFIEPGSPAAEVGMETGDCIVRANGQQIDDIHEIQTLFDEDADGIVQIGIRRISGTDTIIIDKEATLNMRRRLGFRILYPPAYSTRKRTLAESLRYVILSQKSDFEAAIKLFVGRTAKTSRISGGPVHISEAFEPTMTWGAMINMCASLAFLVGIWNILPYLRSAFWEVLPLLYETVTRKKYPVKIFQISLVAGWVIFWLVIAIRLYFDIASAFDHLN